MSGNLIAYYPDEIELFEGNLVAEHTVNTRDNSIITQVEVPDDSSLGFQIVSRKLHPLRTIHTAYFTRFGGRSIRVCSVDLKLGPQPSIENIARAILAEQLAETP